MALSLWDTGLPRTEPASAHRPYFSPYPLGDNLSLCIFSGYQWARRWLWSLGSELSVWLK